MEPSRPNLDGCPTLTAEMVSVAHLTSVHGPTDTRIFGKECRTLAEAGYQVTLVAPAPRDDELHGVRISAVPEPGGRLERMTRTVHAVHRRATHIDADVYHLHDPELLGVGVALRRRGKRVIYDVHEDVPRDILSKDWLPPHARRAVGRGAETLENACARRMSAVIAATPTLAERLAPLNPRTVTVNNYPVLGDLSVPAGQWAERERAVCYVGDINAVRGTIEMVDAAGIADVRLLLGGTFSERGLRERAASRPGWRNVTELGQLSKPDVAATFSRAHAGLVVLHPEPNHVNGRPNKLFEYMSAGLPVIASDFPLWRSFVQESSCGICVDPMDPRQIAGAITRLVDDPAEARAMGARGREAVERRFNWDTEARTLLELYAALT